MIDGRKRRASINKTLLDEQIANALVHNAVNDGFLISVNGGEKVVKRSRIQASSVSGKRVLPEHLVSSSASNALFFEEEGVRSAYGKFCAPIEAKRCQWSGAATHPDDMRICALLGLAVHFQFIADLSGQLQPVEELLGARDARQMLASSGTEFIRSSSKSLRPGSAA